MQDFAFGCQTITWGENLAPRFAGIFDAVASAGYSGVEIGWRHIAATRPAELAGLLKPRGLALIGTHLGGNLFDPAGAKAERNVIETALDFVAALGAQVILYSGLRFDSASQFARDLDALNRAAELADRRGCRLLYHNHDWEFAPAGPGPAIEAILRDGSPRLGLCPDLGWVAKAGQDVLGFLGRVKGRIGAVHFKDFASTVKAEGPIDTVELGRGVTPLREAAAWIRRELEPMWIIAEQDRSALPPAEAAKANAAFLRAAFGQGGRP